MSSSGSVKLRYEKCLQVWGNARSADLESPAADCMSSVKDLENQGIGSEWHTYESATHCWDCKELNGFTKTAANGDKVTYLYDKGATQDSEQRVLKFFEKFQTTLK